MYVDFKNKTDPFHSNLGFNLLKTIPSDYQLIDMMIEKHYLSHCDDWLTFSCIYKEDSYFKIKDFLTEIVPPNAAELA